MLYPDFNMHYLGFCDVVESQCDLRKCPKMAAHRKRTRNTFLNPFFNFIKTILMFHSVSLKNNVKWINGLRHELPNQGTKLQSHAKSYDWDQSWCHIGARFAVKQKQNIVAGQTHINFIYNRKTKVEQNFNQKLNRILTKTISQNDFGCFLMTEQYL